MKSEDSSLGKAVCTWQHNREYKYFLEIWVLQMFALATLLWKKSKLSHAIVASSWMVLVLSLVATVYSQYWVAWT